MSFQRQLNGTLRLYGECLKEASLGFVKNWTVLPGCFAAYVAFSFAMRIFAPLGIVGGFLLGAITLALLTYYYTWVRETAAGRKLQFQDLIEFDLGLFFNLMSVAFLLWIFSGLILQPLIASSDNSALGAGIQMLIFLSFNSIVETVYQKGYESVAAFQFSLVFTKEHFIEWFFPLLVLVSPVLFTLPILVLFVFAQTDVMVPGIVVLSSWNTLTNFPEIPSLVFGLLASHWFTLFRAHLFIGLDSGKHRRLY